MEKDLWQGFQPPRSSSCKATLWWLRSGKHIPAWKKNINELKNKITCQKTNLHKKIHYIFKNTLSKSKPQRQILKPNKAISWQRAIVWNAWSDSRIALTCFKDKLFVVQLNCEVSDGPLRKITVQNMIYWVSNKWTMFCRVSFSNFTPFFVWNSLLPKCSAPHLSGAHSAAWEGHSYVKFVTLLTSARRYIFPCLYVCLFVCL